MQQSTRFFKSSGSNLSLRSMTISTWFHSTTGRAGTVHSPRRSPTQGLVSPNCILDWSERTIGLRTISVHSVCDWFVQDHNCCLIVNHKAFLVPANAMLSVELTHLADILDSAKQAKNISQLARKYSFTIENAIWETTVRTSFCVTMTSC